MHSTYFTSDLHFHHERICEFTERKYFTTQNEHDSWVISLWNKQVSRSSKVYILGDLSFSHKYEEVAVLLRKLNGQKFLVKGNHDRREILDSLKLSGIIQEWYDYKEIKLGADKTPTCLFHFPCAVWHKQPYGSLMLHGHCHGSFQGQGKCLDVGLDNSYKIFGEHKLFSEQDVLEYMRSINTVGADLQTRELQVLDHHNIR